MKINDLITSFEIFVSNEERDILEQIQKPEPLSSFKEREKHVIENLVRKSLVSKLSSNGYIYVMKND